MSAEWAAVTTRNLATSGRTRGELRAMLRSGELNRARRGVFLAGERLAGVPGWHQRVAVAAVRGVDGPLTGQAAAALYGFDGFEPGVPVAVQVAPSASGRFAGARRLQRLDDPVEVAGVWCTSPAETLLGLAADLAPRPGCAAAHRPLPPVDLVELAVETALRRELVSVEGLVDICGRANRKRPGRGVLLEVLARRPEQPPTESYLETRVEQVLRDAGLPTFDRQVELGDEDGFIGRVDFFRAGLVIEAHGKAWHLTTFDPDQVRASRLAAAGHRVLPFSFADVESRPAHVVRTVGRALARAAA